MQLVEFNLDLEYKANSEPELVYNYIEVEVSMLDR